MSDFKKKLVRLAYKKPELREHLLPLLKSAAGKGFLVAAVPGKISSLNPQDASSIKRFLNQVHMYDTIDYAGFRKIQSGVTMSYEWITTAMVIEISDEIEDMINRSGLSLSVKRALIEWIPTLPPTGDSMMLVHVNGQWLANQGLRTTM